MTPKITKILLD